MSFGGGFGFGGSSSNNQPSAFGGGGFGSTTNNNNTTGGGLFGGGASTSGFGSTTGGFGSTGSAFAAPKPAFGASTTAAGGGLFGNSAATTTNTGFGGFGSAANATNTTASAFGGGGTASLFGASKPAATAFGTANTNTTGSLFGGGATTGGFGSTSTSGFGAANNPGLNTNIGDPPGTQVTPFQPTVEKEPTSSTAQNSFQNILFQEAYKKWSADELRLTDYAQGRRYGNGTGGGAFGNSSFGAGAFGSTTQATPSAFGGGTTGGGLFGSNNNNTTSNTSFGATGATGNAFGGGGGLFGAQNKPATPGLFGATPAQPAAQTNSLFGGGAFGSTTATNAGSAFGANNNATTGGLFGGANANANKPATGFGAFGAPAATGTTSAFGGNTGSAFGSTAAAPVAGLFGNNAQQPAQQQTGGLFGQTAQNTGSAFGTSFGQQNQQQQQQQQGSSLFGAKPAGSLFGATAGAPAAGGGLFGGNAAATTSTPFGAAATNTAGGGLFGAKPAATGGGLFGAAGAQQGTTSGGLFGGLGANTQTQQQPAAGGGLFGGSLGATAAKPSLFGTSQGTGGGAFGQPQQAQQGSLFGGSQQQPAQGGSLFGGSQSQSAGQPLTTSLADMSAFGTSSLFAGAATNELNNPGPLATPLSSAKKPQPRTSILPIYKLSKPQTPKRGFGFSYSTYGSPATPSSANSTPGGFGQSLLAGSVGRSLNKSISSSSLRRSFTPEDSILAPGAFSNSVGARSHGSTVGMKRLVINRDIRSDLFSTPNKDRQPQDLTSGSRKSKRVSFDSAAIEGESQTATPNSAQDLGYLRPSSQRSNGIIGSPKSADAAPEMEQIKGKELAIVHEEESPRPTPRSSDGIADKEAGAYWMRPSMEEIQQMNRVQRQAVADFTVGRENIGQVRFLVPVDLTNIDLDEVFEGLVVLEHRTCTVYPVPARKPAMGKGLNVPAEISLEQSWPRGKDKGNRERTLARHIQRLKRIENTDFVSFDNDTGVWTFKVPHFTTYAMGEDDDDEEDEEQTNESALPALEEKHVQAETTTTLVFSSDDEPFGFKRPRRHVPGAFDPSAAAMDYEDVPETHAYVRPPSPIGPSDSARGDHAADFPQDQADLEMTVEDDYESPETAMAQNHLSNPAHSPFEPLISIETPAGVMRARLRAIRESTAPARFEVIGGDDWMDILKKSVNSGKQRDRAALHSLQESPVKKPTMQHVREKAAAKRVVSAGPGFATSIDLMNSLFGKEAPVDESAAVVQPVKSFIKWPYQKQHQDPAVAGAMDDKRRQFHNSFKPRWGPDGTLIVTKRPGQTWSSGDLAQTGTSIASGRGELLSAKLAPQKAVTQESRYRSWVSTRAGLDKIPEVVRPDRIPSFKEVLAESSNSSPASAYEGLVWELASILFDPVDGPNEKLVRRQKLSEFWQRLVQQRTSDAISEAMRSDEKAFACLSGHRVVEACKHLLDAKLFKLATLVPLIGSSDKAKEDMAEQWQEWHDGDVLSEVEPPIRAIYGLLAGNVAVCHGKMGAGSENRLDTLILADTFRLDWLQAFGLRLWYGISTSDDISTAVATAEEDMGQGLIPLPVPWYVGGVAYEDKENQAGVQDIMWGLLKLYARRAELEDVLQPESCSPSHTDYSICWQLAQLLSVSGKASFQSRDKADALTISYGAQLMDQMNWTQAVVVLLHLSEKGSRAKAVQKAMARVAMHLAAVPYRKDGQDQSVKQLLELERYHIPKAWIAEACALAYRHLAARADCTHPSNFHLALKEVRCLALAERPLELQAAVVGRLDPLAILRWAPGRDAEALARYLRARPVNDGLADVVALVGGKGGRERFDFDRYLGLLRKKYEEAADNDVVTLAAITSLSEWVEGVRLAV